MEKKNYRTVIRQEDKAKVISLYNVGRTMSEISGIVNFSPETVKKIIKSETGNYTEMNPNFLKKDNLKPTPRLSEEKIKAKVINLYNEGKDINGIVETVKYVTKAKAIKILVNNNLMDPPKKRVRRSTDPIEKSDIEQFKRDCKIGDKFELTENNGFDKILVTVTVTSLYKNFAMTDKGAFQYVQLFSGKKLEN